MNISLITIITIMMVLMAPIIATDGIIEEKIGFMMDYVCSARVRTCCSRCNGSRRRHCDTLWASPRTHCISRHPKHQNIYSATGKCCYGTGTDTERNLSVALCEEAVATTRTLEAENIETVLVDVYGEEACVCTLLARCNGRSVA